MYLYTKSLKSLIAFFFCFALNNFGFSQNLIKNGQFDKVLSNWNVDYKEESPALKMQVSARNKFFEDSGLAPEESSFNFVELVSTATLQQNIATKQSESYTLVFAYSHRPNAGNKKLLVVIDGITVHTLDIPNNPELGHFQYQQIHFNAPSNDSKISFYVASGASTKDKGVLITDVLCQKTSEINLDLYSSSNKVSLKH